MRIFLDKLRTEYLSYDNFYHKGAFLKQCGKDLSIDCCAGGMDGIYLEKEPDSVDEQSLLQMETTTYVI